MHHNFAGHPKLSHVLNLHLQHNAYMKHELSANHDALKRLMTVSQGLSEQLTKHSLWQMVGRRHDTSGETQRFSQGKLGDWMWRLVEREIGPGLGL